MNSKEYFINAYNDSLSHLIYLHEKQKMSSNVQFSIEQLRCQYNDKPVLHIDSLVIPRNKLVFILGASGVGKSTLIETLGLMNNTIDATSNSKVMAHAINDDLINLKEVWNRDDKHISETRRRLFSFIFQSTNLMPNFTAGENMSINLLINGKGFLEVKPKILSIMEKLDLDEELFDKDVSKLSGGQRQRVAFVRAILGNYEVLFGDEPTGNLDQRTAFTLMEILKTYLVDKTGIIVSHDINLALNFADIIIVLSKKCNGDTNTFGYLKEEDVYFKNETEWTNRGSTKIDNLESLLLKKL